MKRLIPLILVLTFSLGVYAQQEPKMALVFKEMPDSLFPYLTHNSRLDMLDFMEANMKAEVTNVLDGKSEMTYLSSDSLCMRLSDVLTMEMKLLTDNGKSGDKHSVQIVRTYVINKNQSERVVDIYSSDWHRLSSKVVSSSLKSRDEELLVKPHF